MTDDERTVTVKVTWDVTHQVQVPADLERIGPSDIEAVLIYDNLAFSDGAPDMVDWEIADAH